MTRPLFVGAPDCRLALYRACLVLAAILPIPIARCTAWGLAHLAWLVDAPGRRRVDGNLRRWLGGGTSRRAYVGFAFMLADACHLLRPRGRRAILDRIRLVDPWGVFAARPRREPAIIATLHANWELMAAAVLDQGLVTTMASLVLPDPDVRLDRLLAGIRERYAHHSLILGPATVHEALTHLTTGGALGVAVDRDYSGQGPVLRFGSAARRIPRGPAVLARRGTVPIIPLLLVRRGWDRYLLLVTRPLSAEGRPDRELMQAVVDQLVPLLRAAPGQWVHFHHEADRHRDR